MALSRRNGISCRDTICGQCWQAGNNTGNSPQQGGNGKADRYSSAINTANDWLKENKKVARNIFLTTSSQCSAPWQMISAAAEETAYRKYPDCSSDRSQRSRINYRDQWASHPTLEERKLNLTRRQWTRFRTLPAHADHFQTI